MVPLLQRRARKPLLTSKAWHSVKSHVIQNYAQQTNKNENDK